MRYDILYIKGQTSINGDEELRYSLRSLERYGCYYKRIFITGECPDFIDQRKVIYTKEQDIGCPMINHWWKVHQTIKKTDISPNFVLMYDDIFFMGVQDMTKIPYYFKGFLGNARNGGTLYQESLRNAEQWLLNKGRSTFDFELHKPIIYNRKNFLKLEKIFGPMKDENPAMAVRSIYGNLFVKYPTYQEDIKIREADVRVENLSALHSCFSVSDKAFTCHVLPWCKEHFQTKGRYEK